LPTKALAAKQFVTGLKQNVGTFISFLSQTYHWQFFCLFLVSAGPSPIINIHGIFWKMTFISFVASSHFYISKEREIQHSRPCCIFVK
jgi:hypothetical protein